MIRNIRDKSFFNIHTFSKFQHAISLARIASMVINRLSLCFWANLTGWKPSLISRKIHLALYFKCTLYPFLYTLVFYKEIELVQIYVLDHKALSKTI